MEGSFSFNIVTASFMNLCLIPFKAEGSIISFILIVVTATSSFLISSKREAVAIPI